MERRLWEKTGYVTTAVCSCYVCETQRSVSVITNHLPTSPKPHFFSIFAAIFNWCNIRFLASAIRKDTRRVTCEVHIYGPGAVVCTANSLSGGGTAYFGISAQTRPFLQQKPEVSEAQMLRFYFRGSFLCQLSLRKAYAGTLSCRTRVFFKPQGLVQHDLFSAIFKCCNATKRVDNNNFKGEENLWNIR